jgi:hypothetical protein
VRVQSGCGTCQDIISELNRLQRLGQFQVPVINSTDPDEAREWGQEGETFQDSEKQPELAAPQRVPQKELI